MKKKKKKQFLLCQCLKWYNIFHLYAKDKNAVYKSSTQRYIKQKKKKNNNLNVNGIPNQCFYYTITILNVQLLKITDMHLTCLLTFMRCNTALPSLKFLPCEY